MPRESADTKAARLLRENAVRILHGESRPGFAAAEVRSGENTYRVVVRLEGGRLYRECSCPAGQVRPVHCRCAHAKATIRALWRE